MPYHYFGKTSLYKGKPLFKILCHLKDYGRGRIVYRTIDFYDHPDKISFYRILFAQPEMDEKTERGRVVAERVYCNRRMKNPQILSDIAYKPDFRLVPKDEEGEFCKWDQIKDYDISKDAPLKPKYMDMPPLMKEVIRRARFSKGEPEPTDEDLRLPAYKIYEDDFNLEDKSQSNLMAQYLDATHATYKDFDIKSMPEELKMERFNYKHPVGHKLYHGYLEGDGWEKQKVNIEEEKHLLGRLNEQKELFK